MNDNGVWLISRFALVIVLAVVGSLFRVTWSRMSAEW